MAYPDYNQPPAQNWSDTNERGTTQILLDLYLSRLQSAGSFACSGSCESFALPGLEVDGLGPIGLPLSERDTAALIGRCHKSPFGKGSETYVDESVRKTWELDATDFTFTNPSWEKTETSILSKVTADLGISLPTGVKLVPHRYKLLLYEQGAMFKPHKDTEKVPGMCATLAICLPSKHQGGELHLTHGKDAKVFTTSDTSAFGLSYLSWYADVTHEVKAVTSGSRLVITYNLATESSAGPLYGQTAGRMDIENNHFRSLFANWNKTPAAKSLFYLLEHQYTDASLCYDSLKGKDALKARALKQAADHGSVNIYLASIERTSMGDDDDPDMEEDMGVYMRRLVNLEGDELTTNIEIDMDQFVQSDPYQDREPDDEEHEGFTGNEGAPITYYYRDTALVLVPRSLNVTFLLKPNLSNPARLHVIFKQMYEDFDRDPLHQEKRRALKKACDIVRLEKGFPTGSDYYHTNTHGYINTVAETIVTCYLRLDETGCAFKALRLFTSSISDATLLQTSELITTANFQDFLHGCTTHVDFSTSVLSKMAVTKKIHIAVEQNARGPDKEAVMQRLKKWEENILFSAIGSAPTLGYAEATAIIDMMRSFGEDFFHNRVVHLFSQSQVSNIFKVALVVQLLRASSDQSLIYIKSSISKILHSTISSFDIKPLLQVGEYGQGTSREEESAGIAALYGECIGADQKDQATLLLRKMRGQRHLVRTIDCRRIILPFLKYLSSVLSFRHVPHSDPEIQNCFRELLGTYRDCCVGPEPAQPRDWTRLATTSCRCALCTELNQFLTHPQQQTKRFSVATKARNHLADQVHDTRSFRTETERRKSPYTLVITKINDWVPHQHKIWKASRQKAIESITALGRCVLEQCLGVEVGQPFTLDHLSEDAHVVLTAGVLPHAVQPMVRPVTSPTSQPLVTEQNERQSSDKGLQKRQSPRPSSVPQKRKAIDFVDLS